jgi:predicted ATPase
VRLTANVSCRKPLAAMPRVILTGGPGVGKTTLLCQLASLGHVVVDESARALICERMSAGLSPRPEALAFASEILRRDMVKYERTADTANWIFFDRSPLEALAMVQEVAPRPGVEVEAAIAGFRFHRTVFVLPPWPDIYIQDKERDHSLEHCLAVHESLVSWYSRCRYHIYEVPRLHVAERVEYVLQFLAESGA